MFKGAGVVLSATNALESQNTVGIEDSHQKRRPENWEGARQRKIPTLRDVLRIVAKVYRKCADPDKSAAP
jgi:hypothetical protein